MDFTLETWCLGDRHMLAEEQGMKIYEELPSAALAFLAENGISLKAVLIATGELAPEAMRLELDWKHLIYHLSMSKEGNPGSPVLRAYDRPSKRWITRDDDGEKWSSTGVYLSFFQRIINQTLSHYGPMGHHDPFGPSEEAA